MTASLLLIVFAVAGLAKSGNKAEVMVAEKDTTIHDTVVQMAEYKGGEKKCFEFLSRNIRYPFVCLEFKYGGRVLVQFVVERNGRLSSVHAVRTLNGKRTPEDRIVTDREALLFKMAYAEHSSEVHEGMNLADLLVDEAVCVVKSMPSWNAARDANGKKVRMRFTLPVFFKPQ